MVTELGEPLEVLRLLQLPWQERLRVCLGLLRLIAYMEHSPLGPLIIRDFRHQQFVLVDGEIKLCDVDDVDNEQRACATDEDCVVRTVHGNRTLTCGSDRTCLGYNQAVNILNTCRYFLDHILIPEAPDVFREELQAIVIGGNSMQLTSEQLLTRLQGVVDRVREGEHIKIDPQAIANFDEFPEMDFPALHDYYCEYSRQVGACQVAVGSLDQAKEKCAEDPQCRAFVVTSARTWIGHMIVYMKDGASGMRYNKDTVTFVKKLRPQGHEDRILTRFFKLTFN
ncbi:predicted protein [Nematostella vectensis]|uniref:FAM69 protein-kinase domain-containing protein n=2 Tax=Nematostella vectensis TaxID=45351 RepID=A7SNF2_NEMVE|nr:predicted protein [Nematostella vectensis]|eukprot:XP_001626869.1 predicted protein [Nematostella vectensis]